MQVYSNRLTNDRPDPSIAFLLILPEVSEVLILELSPSEFIARPFNLKVKGWSSFALHWIVLIGFISIRINVTPDPKHRRFSLDVINPYTPVLPVVKLDNCRW